MWPPRDWAYARVPVKGKLPIGPMPISPLMLSPETLPMNSRVNGIGLVIETFQLTASPLTVPSKISAVLPFAPWGSASVPPEADDLPQEPVGHAAAGDRHRPDHGSGLVRQGVQTCS